MGTEANREILAQTGLLAPEAAAAGADDLVIVIKAQDSTSAKAALGKVDELLARRRAGMDQEYLPKSLESAAQALPQAGWVLISVPGRYAAGRPALRRPSTMRAYSFRNCGLSDQPS